MNIWVNGCFDILHTGHIDLLWYAKLYNIDTDIYYYDALKSNTLIVGIDTDERVKTLKGDNRPINNLNFRMKMLFNLKMVDTVVSFDDDDELKQLIKKNDIDYIIVGDHYKHKNVIGSEFAKHGVIYYPTDERSTTNIINKIKQV